MITLLLLVFLIASALFFKELFKLALILFVAYIAIKAILGGISLLLHLLPILLVGLLIVWLVRKIGSQRKY